MNVPVLDLVLVAVFILVGGVFAATELALVTLREAQAKALADKGKRGARVARLLSNPNRFLAAVQVGVTLAGFLSAAFGAARLAVLLAGQRPDVLDDRVGQRGHFLHPIHLSPPFAFPPAL